MSGDPIRCMEPVPSLRAWYGAPIAQFMEAASEAILGTLASHSEFAVLPTQRDAWVSQITILKDCLRGLAGAVFLEFNIPRMGRRIDAVVVSGPVVFILEFKVGESEFDRAAIEQVWDYALDLKNFHKGSHEVTLVPLLVSTEANPIGGVSEFYLDNPESVRSGFGTWIQDLQCQQQGHRNHAGQIHSNCETRFILAQCSQGASGVLSARRALTAR